MKKCSYCDFLSFPLAYGQGFNGKDSFYSCVKPHSPDKSVCQTLQYPEVMAEDIVGLYIDALLKEIETAPLKGRAIDTVYIGGGTPSFISAEWIDLVLCKLNAHCPISASAEISIEANPGTLSPDKLKCYKKAGINRISLGCQSLNDGELKLIGRIHSPEDFYRSYEEVRKAGFSNVNVDLMSALPRQTTATFSDTLSKLTALSPEHISVYSLIVEPHTPLYESLRQGELALPDEETVEKIDNITLESLKGAGYMRYEISNYAHPGCSCRHNLIYWDRGEYLGLGLGSASFFHGKRWKNTGDLRLYLKKPGKAREEEHILSEREAMEEFLFLGLRKTAGISQKKFLQTFNKKLEEIYGDVLSKQLREGFLIKTADGYAYNEKGLNVSNILLSEFIG